MKVMQLGPGTRDSMSTSVKSACGVHFEGDGTVLDDDCSVRPGFVGVENLTGLLLGEELRVKYDMIDEDGGPMVSNVSLQDCTDHDMEENATKWKKSIAEVEQSRSVSCAAKTFHLRNIKSETLIWHQSLQIALYAITQ